MDNNTPIQEAIYFWNERKMEAPTLQLQDAAEMFVRYLESLLPKERKFVKEIWEKGQFSTDSIEMHQYINQLYPKP